MNRRILKKRCKAAVEILIEKHGYSRSAFFPADGDEAISTPPCFEPPNRRKRVGRSSIAFLDPGPLKGTMLLWEDSYYGDGDCKLPSEVLREIEYWESLSDDELREMALVPGEAACAAE